MIGGVGTRDIRCVASGPITVMMINTRNRRPPLESPSRERVELEQVDHQSLATKSAYAVSGSGQKSRWQAVRRSQEGEKLGERARKARSFWRTRSASREVRSPFHILSPEQLNTNSQIFTARELAKPVNVADTRIGVNTRPYSGCDVCQGGSDQDEIGQITTSPRFLEG